MPESAIKKFESGRAKFAYDCALEGKAIVSQAFEINGKWYKDKNYKSYVKRIPAMILSNGLGHTLAFILSKRKGGQSSQEKPLNAYDLIAKQIFDYLNSDATAVKFSIPKKEDEAEALVEFVVNCDPQTYRQLTNEILAFFNWLRRFAEGLIEGGED
ncbi:type III-B CRISPR module-associated protein Cmr5 [Fervidobacterium sp.]